MRYRTGISFGFAFALVLAAVLAPVAGADGRKPSKTDSDLLPLSTFNTSGEFSGVLGGEIILNGVRYQLGSNVQIYELGVGLLPAGTEINDRWIFLSGVRTMGADMIFSVIVRPATVPSLTRMTATVSRCGTAPTRSEDDHGRERTDSGNAPGLVRARTARTGLRAARGRLLRRRRREREESDHGGPS